MVIFRCQQSIESIFTAIYQAYEEKRDLADTRLSLTEDPILFAEDVAVVPDPEKVRKVMRTLRQRFGEGDYESLCLAIASEDEDCAQAVFGTVVCGLAMKPAKGHLFDHLTNADCMRAFELSRGAGRELSHMLGFLRFQELKNGVLYAEIGPKNNLLTFMAPHFADRFPGENFVIHDTTRGIFVLHPAGKQWVLGQAGKEDVTLEYSEKEGYYAELFRGFTKAIAIKERTNLRLQRNMLPLRFREYMIEFQFGG